MSSVRRCTELFKNLEKRSKAFNFSVDETLKRDVIAFELSFKSSLNENLNELTKRTARYEISHVNALRAKGCRVIGSSD